jgi:hypothetical protein
VLFPVHPTMAARWRETFCTSGAKNDPGDTAWWLDLWMRHRENWESSLALWADRRLLVQSSDRSRPPR